MAAGLALLIAAGVVVALVARSGSGRSSDTTAGAIKPQGAATVWRRDLVATDTESGTLSYADAQTVYNRLTGTITWLPQVGQEIGPGGVLYRVDGAPIILMNGSTPAYRTLNAAAIEGLDVLELNRNLRRLGFNAAAIPADDVWQPATTLGVEELQESLDEDPTGSLTLGEVVFLPGPQLVSSLDTSVGSTGSGGGSASNAAAAAAQDSSMESPAPAPEFVGLTSTTQTATSTQRATSTTSPTTQTSTTTATTTPTSTTPTASTSNFPSRLGSSDTGAKALSALTSQLKAESAQLKAATAALKAVAHKASLDNKPSSSTAGGGGGSAQAILQTTSTRLVVTVELAASSQSEARVGEHVTVELPAGNTVNARITAVSRVAQTSSSGGGPGESGSAASGSGSPSSASSSTVPVTIALADRHSAAGLDQAAVSVNFISERARHVLSVPVTALVATSGSSYALQEADAPHTLLPVTVGLFAAGYVQVSGMGMHAGLAVTDSQG